MRAGRHDDAMDAVHSFAEATDLTRIDARTRHDFLAALAWLSAVQWQADLAAKNSKARSRSAGPLWPSGGAMPCPAEIVGRAPSTGGSPLLSVMIPVYNVANPDWLEQSIESARVQALKAYRTEIIVVDDRSGNDEARTIAEQFGGDVRYERNTGNLGILANHNRCIALASGRFVHILHQDDRIEPGFYQATIEPMLQDESLVAAFTRAGKIDTHGKEFRQQDLLATAAGPVENLARMLALRQHISFPSMIVRRAAYARVGGFSKDLDFAFDQEMWSRLAAAGPVWYDPRLLAYHREHPAAVTSQTSAINQMTDCFRAVAHMTVLFPAAEQPEIARVALARIIYGRLVAATTAAPKRSDASRTADVVGFILRHWPDAGARQKITQALGFRAS